jgi:protein-S-isoprenylcysteine O-methyltransferase Ste14
MNNKIPPPVVTLICGIIIYFSRSLFPEITFQSINIISVLILLTGIGTLLTAASSFKKYQTTINPLQPDKATHLVVSGIFGISRNPMYLGMALILLAISVKFNMVGGIIITFIFISFITKFQIIPEEKAMKKLFADEFLHYTKQTRRWI